MTVPAPDVPFHHYTAKHRLVAWISQTLFDNFTYTVSHGLLRGMKRKGGLAWVPEFVAGSTNTAEVAFWKELDLKDMVIYDIGAFQGLLTLFFARQGSQVVSYEPNSKNRARLMENLRLNGIKNVQVRPFGAGAAAAEATMVVSSLMPGGASIESAAVEGMLKSNAPVTSEQITIVTLDDDIAAQGLPSPEFIKVDVEGQELSVLQGARKTLLAHKPQLFLEMHGETMNLKRRKVAEIVAFLEELGYTDIRHVESGAQLHSGNSALAAEGHLYCPSEPKSHSGSVQAAQ